MPYLSLDWLSVRAEAHGGWGGGAPRLPAGNQATAHGCIASSERLGTAIVLSRPILAGDR
jgi:hypothetical protein